jgi:hypothetical protein
MVCRKQFKTKKDLNEHTEEAHGNNWPVGWLTRSKDQMEFKPSLSQTPWGREFREGPRQ